LKMTKFLAAGVTGQQFTAQQWEKMERVIAAALEAADPRAAVRRVVSLVGDRLEIAGQSFDLSGFRRIRLIGAGKASQAMARGLLDVLGERVSAGLLIAKHLSDGQEPLPAQVRVLLGGHPVPSAESVASAQELVHFLQPGLDGTGMEDDLLFILISGGGSALMTLPVEGITLADLQELTRQLLACGAEIGEINTLRKHLDQVKGGGLARLAAPARVITLILSDVIGSPLDVIASGPTVADSTTYEQAIDILRKYEIEDQVPAAIRRVLERGARGELPETVKANSPALARVTNRIVASNPQAAEAALAEARAHGFNTLLLTTSLQGEAAGAGGRLALLLKGVAEEGQPLQRPACIVVGGETTVTLRGNGKGGRNQEMALAAAMLLANVPQVAFVTFATDGEDGPTDAAGAVVSGETFRRAQTLGFDPQAYLQNNDSYNFFAALGDLIITGPTGTNVNDLVFMFAFAVNSLD
jgi:hydroxypyruvate reductase